MYSLTPKYSVRWRKRLFIHIWCNASKYLVQSKSISNQRNANIGTNVKICTFRHCKTICLLVYYKHKTKFCLHTYIHLYSCLCYPTCAAHVPHYTAIYVTYGSTTPFHIILYTTQILEKCYRTKNVFRFSLQLLSETFRIPRGIQQDITTNVWAR